MYSVYIVYFIALIHPIQWTIANPVSADQPAKCQKKTPCVSTCQAGQVLCTRQVAHHTSFLSRQRDVIASFSFGACIVHTDVFGGKFFVLYCWNIWIFYLFIVVTDTCQCIAHPLLP